MKFCFNGLNHTSVNGLPGGWIVERNSDLKEVPAIRMDEKGETIELLSAGNKFLPCTPVLENGSIRALFSINGDITNEFSFVLCFRYDSPSRKGQAVKLTGIKAENKIRLEYGKTAENRFFPAESFEQTGSEELFRGIFDFSLDLKGTALSVTASKAKFSLSVEPGKGRFSLAREHFFDVFRIHSFLLESEDSLPERTKRSFPIQIPEEPSMEPLYCDVTLTDRGDCCEADLCFHGGVSDTTPGEGNYHVMRMNLLTDPYFKILPAGSSMEKHRLYEGRMVLVPPGIAPDYFYKLVHKKPEWPLHRKVIFLKPTGAYELAVGFGLNVERDRPDLSQKDSETRFTPEGTILSSGASLTEGAIRCEFRSRPDKQIIARLPKTDPRYEDAVRFAKRNHFFQPGEEPEFSVRLTSEGPLPLNYQFVLEDAFLRPVRTLAAKVRFSEIQSGLRKAAVAEIFPEGKILCDPGVWHLRLRSTDPTAPDFEEYCAFEVMPADPASPPTPLLSGLPFLYDSRTETRGLRTDAFDVWRGESIDSCHYVACSHFLAAAARKYQVIPTIHAYGRKHFLWIGSRCADHFEPEENMDLIRQTDFLNIRETLIHYNLLTLWKYEGVWLDWLIEFVSGLPKTRLDLVRLKKIRSENGRLDKEDPESFNILCEDHWEAWVDFTNRKYEERSFGTLQKLRKENPNLCYAEYGPAHIYAAHLKGPEFLRYLLADAGTCKGMAFWQYEDYPYACRYGLERGLYFLTACLMVRPDDRICPEIYTGDGIQGCPDGAVYYAHPPFGSKRRTLPVRLRRQFFNFAYGSAWFSGKEFRYWTKMGFQACLFSRPWYEQLLRTAGEIRDNQPLAPLRSACFVSSDRGRRHNGRLIVQETPYKTIPDVRTFTTEFVPYLFEVSRRSGLLSGFLATDDRLPELKAENVDTLVLPPLDGMAPEVLAAIRRLHSEGVNLISCCDVTGLEDLFGVRNTGKTIVFQHLKTSETFLNGKEEPCIGELCTGSWENVSAEVLIQGEKAFLTRKQNGKASAFFFNGMPHLVRPDLLIHRHGYGKDGISPLMEEASAAILKECSSGEITVSGGELLTCRTANGNTAAVILNHDEDQPLIADLTAKNRTFLSAGVPAVPLREDGNSCTVRIRIEPGNAGMVLFREQSI